MRFNENICVETDLTHGSYGNNFDTELLTSNRKILARCQFENVKLRAWEPKTQEKGQQVKGLSHSVRQRFTKPNAY